jgi:simple sugar transport system ATP-binding protein
MRGIRKSFNGKVVNESIDLDLRAGDIVGLLGENGAGKTTLMNILFGLYHPDAGEILINGKPVRFSSPNDAMAAGVGMVHQHFMLVPNHTVLENIVAAMPEAPFINPHGWVRKRIEAFESQFRLGIDPTQPAYNLSAGELQRVEILKALLNGAQLLILDEPTSVLSPQEAEELFDVLRSMASQGKIIIIISHKLEEILALCHRVVVLRKGRISGEAPTAGADKAELARMMVGREVEFNRERATGEPGEVILEVCGVSVPGDHGGMAVREASFEVRQREIFGIAGVSGNGQRELAEAITGLRQACAGNIMLDGQDITRATVKQLSARGLAHIPEERMRFGIVPNLLLYENAVLKDYHTEDFSDDLFLKQPAIKNFAEMIVENFRVSAPTINTPIQHLSGGNIQKLILGREITGDPTLLVAAHPTYGLDIGATEYIRSHLMRRRDSGGAILLLSEDLEEIMALCDRIAVMYQGRIMAVVDRTAADLTDIGLMMAGVQPEAPKKPNTPPMEARP